MTDEYLFSKGWKLVGTAYSGCPNRAKLFSHPDHQKNDGRFYTKREAKDKQQFLDRPWAHTDPDLLEFEK